MHNVRWDLSACGFSSIRQDVVGCMGAQTAEGMRLCVLTPARTHSSFTRIRITKGKSCKSFLALMPLLHRHCHQVVFWGLLSIHSISESRTLSNRPTQFTMSFRRTLIRNAVERNDIQPALKKVFVDVTMFCILIFSYLNCVEFPTNWSFLLIGTFQFICVP